MRPTYSIHVVWCHFVLESSTFFFLVLWSMLWPHHQMWLMWPITSNPNSRVLKIEKMKNKWKKESKMKENKKKQSLLSAILTHVYAIRSTCVVHIVWHHPSRIFYIFPCILWLVTMLSDVTCYVTAWSCHF